MTKYLLLAVVILAVIWFARRPSRPKQKVEVTPAAQDGKMLRCAYCRMFLPRAEAIQFAGRAYCSEQHRHLDEAKE